ncbi:MAG: formate dehydrogenase accessory protein FdhE [Thiohalomonadaceae bacterium]
MSAVVKPGEIVSPGTPPALRLASGDVFGHRARRLAQLAQGHAMEAYLAFMARLAEAQQRLFEDEELTFATPDHDLALRLRTEGQAPLAAQHWPRARPWQHVLRRLLAMAAPHAPAATRKAIDALVAAAPEDLEAMASRALRGADPLRDPVADPLIAAALQVYWVHMAAALNPDEIVVSQPSPLCPVCGSAPVASVVHGSGPHQGLRYLNCSLCASEWQLARIRCSHCDGEEGVAYFGAEGRDATVRAEACDDCRSYLKLIHRDRDGAADAVADDLATLDLDLAMAAEGYARSGPNLLFVPGEEIRTIN